MKPRATVILAAIAVVVLALGLVFGVGNREQQAEVPAAQPAFPGLAAKLAGAASIEISQAGKTLHLVRKGDDWTLPDRGGYPVQPARVHELLAGLAELKLSEPRTSNPDQYSRLGVQDPPKEAPKDGRESGATLVRVLDGSGATIVQLLLGHTRPGGAGNGEGIYVRRPGEAQAWLADGRVTADADALEWLDKDIVNVSGDSITGVTVTRGGQTLAFARDNGKLVLHTPAEHPKLDPAKLDEIGHALESLTFDDVKAAPAPGTPDGQAVFTTADGMTITADVSKDGADIWAVFAVGGAAKDKSAADALAAKLKGWAYKLGNWKEAALVPTLDELKAPEPPPAAAAARLPAPAASMPAESAAPAAPEPAPAPAPAPPAEPAPAAK